MTRLSWAALAVVALAARPAGAQMVYTGGAPLPAPPAGYTYVYPTPYAAPAPPAAATAAAPRPYRFSDEPLGSINQSYLGYSNFVWAGPNPPAPGYVTQYGQAVNRGETPPTRGFRLFGRRTRGGY